MADETGMMIKAIYGGMAILLLLGGLADASQNSTSRAATTAQVVLTEALKPPLGDAGRPLPLIGHWSVGPRQGSFGPDYQLELLEDGFPILPTFRMPAAQQHLTGRYYDASIRRAAELGLPIAFVSTQWERLLSDLSEFANLEPARNPHAVTPVGEVLERLSPFGPADLWRQVGQQWGSSAALRKLQEQYPDPPLVIFLSNNEHPRLRWHELHRSARYMEKYGHDRNDNFKRRVTAEGWVERDRALQAGFRDALTSPAWQRNARFVGFAAFGPSAFGRFYEWDRYSLHHDEQITYAPLAWDGGSAAFYLDQNPPFGDHTVFSPQVEAMNWPFMAGQAFEMNPAFWLELSVWDGQQEDHLHRPIGQQGNPPRQEHYSPHRYQGMVRFGMWIVRPRLLREFRHYTTRRAVVEDYFLALCHTVREVHETPQLRDFWQFGELVLNTEHDHPYQERIPEPFADAPRSYLLDASINPARPWKLTTELKVFALALVRGEAPERRWLIYAHAPEGLTQDVTLRVPGYEQAVTIDVPVQGAFYLLKEADGTVTPIAGQPTEP